LSIEPVNDTIRKKENRVSKMKKRRVLSCFLALLLVLLACSGACAELKKGQKGQYVRELQQKLIDLGLMSGRADGNFGNKTERAVKQLQNYWGITRSGKADDDFQTRLDDLWHLALGNGTESGADPADLENPVMTCAHNENAPYGFDYCYRHDEAKALRDLLHPASKRTVPDGLKKVILKRIIEYWLEAIRLNYDEWEESLPDDEQHIAEEQKELFEQGWAEKQAELVKKHKGADKPKTLQAEADWLEELGIEHCFDLHGAEPNLD
jgi:hypothetical protein